MLARALEDGEELVVSERLLDVIESPLVHRLHRRLQRRLRRHQDHRGVGILLARRGEDLDPAHVRHANVGEDDVRLERRELREPLSTAVRGVRVEAGVAQQDPERLEDSLLVVDDQDFGCARGDHVSTAKEEEGVDVGRRDGSARGSTTVKRVPVEPLSTKTRPRCASIARWTTGSPSPLPPGLVVKNGSNSRSRISTGIPEPESLTQSMTPPWSKRVLPRCSGSAGPTVSVTSPPSGDAWMALRRRS